MSEWQDFLRRNLERGNPQPRKPMAEEMPVEHEIHEADGVYIRQINVPMSGTALPQHAHVWDHLTMLAAGRVAVWKDGVYDQAYDAPTGIFIKAGAKHSFVTLQDNTVLYCIHAMHGEDKAAVLAEHDLELV